MLEKLFGIMRRFYYLVATLMTIGYAVNGVSMLFSPRYDKEESLLVLSGAILAFPIAILLHRTTHWIIWGKIK
jgi:hypothetical protein